ncbi:sorbitol-6-phosphate dehydrogenase subunit [Corynebacterium glutamicum]|uniref:sorbitol-6-phosphate dehydrogenase subunit n=1 Tax=Corynebacterium glutamicum TaxID=1718 RepID=UPI002015EFF8|nr:sorbitol-6-phosphate dehydrogenase subunit [Corynebacterium glutamicum]
MVDSWLDIESKVVAVTGGNSGIGAAITKRLRDQGATVVVLDISVETAMEDLEQARIQVDITNVAEMNAAVSLIVDQIGRLDVLVNNAGINLPRLLVDISGEHPEYELDAMSYSKMFDINVKGALFAAQAASRQMVSQGGGVIINISSEAGMEGSVGQSAYAATKGALNSFTRSWGKELAPHNIRVVGVAPGINEPTGLTSPEYNAALAYTRGLKPDQLSTDYKKVIPLGRPGKLSEIADLVVYLASDRASYVAATTYAITGGKSRG